MTHPRKTIRALLYSALQGLPSTANRVYQYRTYPLQPGDLPALRIWIDYDEPLDTTVHSFVAPLARGVRVIVEAVVKQAESAESVIDDVCEEVEAAIEASAPLKAAVQAAAYRGTELVSDLVSDQQVVIARLSFDVAI